MTSSVSLATSVPSEDCSICKEPLSSSLTLQTSCSEVSHFFHQQCLKNWFASSNSKRCPLCRKKIDHLDRLLRKKNQKERVSQAQYAQGASQEETVHRVSSLIQLDNGESFERSGGGRTEEAHNS